MIHLYTPSVIHCARRRRRREDAIPQVIARDVAEVKDEQTRQFEGLHLRKGHASRAHRDPPRIPKRVRYTILPGRLFSPSVYPLMGKTQAMRDLVRTQRLSGENEFEVG